MSRKPLASDRARPGKDSGVMVDETGANVVRMLTTTAPQLAYQNKTQGTKIMFNNAEGLVAFNKGNLEAFTQAGQIWAAGVQDLTKQFAATAKASFDESVATFKALSTVKSVKEAIELQSGFAKTAFEKAVAESNKMADASIKLTEQTLAPITARVTAAVETFGKTA
jgi:phasin family protein